MLNNLLLASGDSGEKLYVEDVFSTYLYTGNGSTANTNQTISNNIDLSTKGGMVWIKNRGSAIDSAVFDTARGVRNVLGTNLTSAASTYNSGYGLTSFNTDGFVVSGNWSTRENANGETYASWTFRKAAKFFDVITYVGDGASTRTLSHSLGVTPGMILIKKTNATEGWFVYHRSEPNKYGGLHSTLAFSAVSIISTTASDFTLNVTVAGNTSGDSYVAYLFAHNASADGIVQCGSFTGADANVSVTLGWEPQLLLVKRTDSTGDWRMFDNMRGMFVDGKTAMLYANTSGAEIATNVNVYAPTATGFVAGSNIVTGTYIYLAIRRGPMRTPTDATKVFSSSTTGTTTFPNFTSGFPVDFGIRAANRINTFVPITGSRLQGAEYLFTNETSAATSSSVMRWDSNTGWYDATGNTTPISWMLRRAPGFFDVTCYSGTGSTRTVSHNLGVAPELMIVKSRSNGANWPVYIPNTPTKYLHLNEAIAAVTSSAAWANTAPTSSSFTVGTYSNTNESGFTYVAYLFASCPGVSKVGSYTGNGSSLNIDCGFTNGARFVLIKRTDSTGSWLVADTARGIVSGNDPSLSLNSAVAEVTTLDWLDPYSAGFTVNQESTNNANVNGATYIYLAIA